VKGMERVETRRGKWREQRGEKEKGSAGK